MKRLEQKEIIPEINSPENIGQITSVDDVLRLERQFPFRTALEQFEVQTGKLFEMVPFEQKEKFILHRLNELVSIMRVNPIWRERLDHVGVARIHEWSDWHRVPITTRDDLRKLYTLSVYIGPKSYAILEKELDYS